MPLAFGPEELKECEGTRLVGEIAKRREALEWSFKYLKARLYLDPSLDFSMKTKEYIKYRCLAESRYFRYPDGPEESRTYKVALNPFIVELIQTGPERNVGWRRQGGVAE